MKKALKALIVIIVVISIAVLCYFIFGKKSYNLTIVNETEGTIICDVNEVKRGESATLTLSANENYLVESVTINGKSQYFEELKTKQTCVVEHIKSDVVVTARFISNPEYFALTDAGAISVKEGATLSGFIVIPSFIGGIKVVSIDNNSFSNKADVVKYDIPKTLQIISPNSFCGLIAKFKGFSVEMGSKTFAVDARGSLYNKQYSNLIYVVKPTLTSYEVAASVSSIQLGAFSDCQNVAEYKVAPDNNSLRSKDGAIYTEDIKELLAFPYAKVVDKSTFLFPSTLAIVQNDAFLNKTQFFRSDAELTSDGVSSGTLVFIKLEGEKRVLIGTEGGIIPISNQLVLLEGCVGFRRGVCEGWKNTTTVFVPKAGFAYDKVVEMGIPKGMEIIKLNAPLANQPLAKRDSTGKLIQIVEFDFKGGTDNGQFIEINASGDKYRILGDNPTIDGKAFYYYTKDYANWMLGENRLDASDACWYDLPSTYETMSAVFLEQNNYWKNVMIDADLSADDGTASNNKIMVFPVNTTEISGIRYLLSYRNFLDQDLLFYTPSLVEYLIFPYGLNTVINSAFRNLSNLKELFFPATTTVISSSVFKSTTSMKKILVDDNNAVYLSKNGILYNRANTADDITTNDTDMSTLVACPIDYLDTLSMWGPKDIDGANKTYYISRGAFGGMPSDGELIVLKLQYSSNFIATSSPSCFNVKIEFLVEDAESVSQVAQALNDSGIEFENNSLILVKDGSGKYTEKKFWYKSSERIWTDAFEEYVL